MPSSSVQSLGMIPGTYLATTPHSTSITSAANSTMVNHRSPPTAAFHNVRIALLHLANASREFADARPFDALVHRRHRRSKCRLVGVVDRDAGFLHFAERLFGLFAPQFA